MGTRSRIAIRNADNTYLSVYCHWDGYPSHHGPILQEHYNSEDKVRALLAGGDFSSLESNFDLIKFYTTTRPHEDPSPAVVSADLDALCVLTQETGGRVAVRVHAGRLAVRAGWLLRVRHAQHQEA